MNNVYGAITGEKAATYKTLDQSAPQKPYECVWGGGVTPQTLREKTAPRTLSLEKPSRKVAAETSNPVFS